MDLKTYNPKEVVIALGNHIVTGYAEDSFVSVEPLGDGVTSKSGCDGEVVRSIDPNDRYTVKIVVQYGSPTTTYLNDRRKLDKKNGTGAFPILIKDLMGNETFKSDVAWVTKAASFSKGKEAGNKEWTLETGQSSMEL